MTLCLYLYSTHEGGDHAVHFGCGLGKGLSFTLVMGTMRYFSESKTSQQPLVTCWLTEVFQGHEGLLPSSDAHSAAANSLPTESLNLDKLFELSFRY